jgi:hypothetical protein
MKSDRLRCVSMSLVSGCVLMLGGCSASSAPKPEFTVPIAAESVVRADDSVIVDVSNASGVYLAEYERQRVLDRIKQKIEERKLSNPGDGSPANYDVHVTITEYEKGSAFARAMLAGLGQIHVRGTVAVYELPARRLVGEFHVAKTFAWGGIYGASTSIEDVEVGFAEGVAAAVTGSVDSRGETHK